MHFRFRYEQRGNYVHMRLFTRGTLGKCGDLTMTVAEFDAFRAHVQGFGFEFVPEKAAAETG